MKVSFDIGVFFSTFFLEKKGGAQNSRLRNALRCAAGQRTRTIYIFEHSFGYRALKDEVSASFTFEEHGTAVSAYSFITEESIWNQWRIRRVYTQSIGGSSQLFLLLI